MRSVVHANTPPCATRHMCTVCRTGRGGCSIYTVQIYCGLAHRCSCSVTAHALAGGVSVVYMRRMIYWGLPRMQACTVWCTGRGGCRAYIVNALQPSDIPITRMQPPVFAPPSYREVGVSMWCREVGVSVIYTTRALKCIGSYTRTPFPARCLIDIHYRV